MRDKVLLVANTAWYLFNFRLPLARHLRDLGYEVVLVSPHDAYAEKLQAENFRWINLGLNRRSVNPLREAVALKRLWSIYRAERPAVCHHFTVKCVLYGTIAAKLAGVPAVVNAITGLGHAFLGESLRNRVVRPVLRFIYRKILTARRVQVIFQNGDDLKEFKDRRMIIPDKTTVIRGSGVNLTRFKPRPGGLDSKPVPTLLLASRLIKQKGLLEYVEAARILKSKGVEAQFALAGDTDPGNPSSVTEAELQGWCKEGLVDYLGHVDPIENVLHMADIVVLPSFREGTPRILLEAAAIGKPIVTTDVPGCREVVTDGVNGFLVPVRDAEALAEALEKLILDEELRQRFGMAGVEHVQDFEEGKVIQATVEVYQKARKRTPDARPRPVSTGA